MAVPQKKAILQKPQATILIGVCMCVVLIVFAIGFALAKAKKVYVLDLKALEVEITSTETGKKHKLTFDTSLEILGKNYESKQSEIEGSMINTMTGISFERLQQKDNLEYATKLIKENLKPIIPAKNFKALYFSNFVFSTPARDPSPDSLKESTNID